MDKHNLVKTLETIRFTNRFILPLVSVSWFTVRDVLRDVWLTEDCSAAVIGTTVVVPGIKHARWYEDGPYWIAVVDIPKEFLQDTKLLVHGKYSRISDRARQAIIDLSGLEYNVVLPNNDIRHSALLIAIDPSEEMLPWRIQLAKQLTEELYGSDGVHALDPSGELLTKLVNREQVFYNKQIPGH